MGNDTRPGALAEPIKNTTNDDSAKKYPNAADGSDFPFKDNFAYIIGASAILCIIVAVIVAVVLWKKHPRRPVSCHSNRDPEKGDNSDVTTQEHKQKKEIETGIAVTNNQQSPGIELVAFDTAPDIITAHDSDSIYETLDGRRAACAKAAANNNNSSSSSSNNGSAQNSPVISSGRVAAGGVDDVIGDPTYDHLGRFLKNPRSRAPVAAAFGAHPGHPVPVNNRFTDPEVSFRRPSVPAHFSPREVRSAWGYLGTERGGGGGSGGGGGGDNELERRKPRGAAAAAAAGISNSDQHRNNSNNGRPMGMCKSCISSTNCSADAVATATPSRRLGSPSLGSAARSASLTEMALLSSSGGKRIVCQLTMVGVVENGKQVIPVSPQPAAGNSYFILEPPRSSPSPGDEDASDDAGRARFRIRNGGPRDGGDCGNEGGAPGNAGTDGSGGGGGGGSASKSEYFLLQPLDQEDDFSELDLSSPPSLEGERDDWRFVKDLNGGNHDHHHHHHLEVGGGDDARARRRAFSHSRELIRRAGVEEEEESAGRHPFHRQSFRDSRLRSCPDATDSADTSPTLPPRNNLTYKRSLSSPLGSLDHHHHHHRHHYQRPDGEEDDDGDDDWDYPAWGRKEKKMDADVLKERIQRELRKFGLLNDDSEPPTSKEGDNDVEDQEDDDDDDEDVLESDAESYNNNTIDFGGRSDPPRPPTTNEYFILEPEPDTYDDSDSDRDFAGGVGVLRIRQDGNNLNPVSANVQPPPLHSTPNLPLPSRPGSENVPPPSPPLPTTSPPGGVGTTAAPAAASGPNERPRYQRQYTTPALPPRNPPRNPRFTRGHNRSKSETPLDLKPESRGAAPCSSERKPGEKEVNLRKGNGPNLDPDEGPVVVSLKSVMKSKSGGDRTDQGGDEPFRPRLKSESGVLSERKTKT